jgi:hypothetical protein
MTLCLKQKTMRTLVCMATGWAHLQCCGQECNQVGLQVEGEVACRGGRTAGHTTTAANSTPGMDILIFMQYNIAAGGATPYIQNTAAAYICCLCAHKVSKPTLPTSTSYTTTVPCCQSSILHPHTHAPAPATRHPATVVETERKIWRGGNRRWMMDCMQHTRKQAAGALLLASADINGHAA